MSNFAVINGEYIELPSEAKYFAQDHYGMWYFFSRKPKVIGGDWSPTNKRPITVGCRVVRTKLVNDDISKTLTSVFKRSDNANQAQEPYLYSVSANTQ